MSRLHRPRQKLQRERTSAMAFELLILHTAHITFSRSPPGTTVEGWWLIPHQKLVGKRYTHTEWCASMVRFIMNTSFGATSLRYMREHGVHLPCRGSHLTIKESCSKANKVMSATDSRSCDAHVQRSVVSKRCR